MTMWQSPFAAAEDKPRRRYPAKPDDGSFNGFIDPTVPGDHPKDRTYGPSILLPLIEEQHGLGHDPGPLDERDLTPGAKSFEDLAPGVLRWYRWKRGQQI